jgi:hypothetical protein
LGDESELELIQFRKRVGKKEEEEMRKKRFSRVPQTHVNIIRNLTASCKYRLLQMGRNTELCKLSVRTIAVAATAPGILLNTRRGAD